MMLGQGAVGLFLDPGLGKTSICLGALRVLKRLGYVKKTLIIAPLRPAYAVWPGEIWKWEEFQEFDYVVLHGPEKDTRLEEDVDLYIINPEGLKWLIEQNLPDFDCLIVDESTKFKDSTTKRFKYLKKMLPMFKRRWILTGTPMPNTLLDLFGQIYILDSGHALERYITHFRLKYFYKPGYNAWEWKPQPGAFDRVVDKIAALIMQLRAEDYLEMPELQYVDVPVYLPEDAMQTYKSVEDDFIAALDEGVILAANAAAAGTKCRQIANGAVYMEDDYVTLHDAKLEALDDILEELSGHPVLLLYEFNHDRERILQRYKNVTDVKTDKDINKLVNDFNAGDIPILLGHPASMGHGLNLQGTCHHVIWFGITWNFEHYDQAIRRVYRQGQESDYVRVYHLVSQGTLDSKVLSALQKKERGQNELLNALRK